MSNLTHALLNATNILNTNLLIAGQPVVGSELPAKGTVVGSIGFQDSCEGLRILVQEIQTSLAGGMIVDVLPTRNIAVILQPA